MRLLRRAKRVLLAPTVVLALLLLLSAVLAGGSFLREKPFALDPRGLDHYLSADGLPHLVTTHGAGALVGLFLASLTVATWDIFRTAWRRTVGRAPPPSWRAVPGASVERVAEAARGAGFLPLRSGASRRRLVRHPWGIWANFLLHAGIAVSAVAFQLHAATARQARVTLLEGGSAAAGEPGEARRLGPLADGFAVPVAVELERVDWKADERGALVDVDSTVALDGAGGHAASPGDGVARWGYRVYHGAAGHAFLLEIAPPDRPAERTLIRLPLPERAGASSYGSLSPPGLPGLLRVKYRVAEEYPDGRVQLTLRLVRGEEILGQVALAPGQSATLGEAAVRLVAVARWSSLLFDGGRGTLAVLLGFGMTIVGAILLYATPPRELVVEPAEAGGARVAWTAFGRLADGELEAILARAARAEGT